MSTLGPDPRATSVAAAGRSVTRHSPAAAKIALFRSPFRGREDVYSRRFESRKTGKSGYAPACANEWVQGICEKPRIKCALCPHRRFLPVTDEVIRWHLSGREAPARSAAHYSVAEPWPLAAPAPSGWPAFADESWEVGHQLRRRTKGVVQNPQGLLSIRLGCHQWRYQPDYVPMNATTDDCQASV